MMKNIENKQISVRQCDKLWLSQKEAIKYIGMSKDWLEKRREEGALHYSKVANSIFYIKSEIDRLVTDGAITGKGFFKKEAVNARGVNL